MRLVRRHGSGAFLCREHAEDGCMDLEPGTCRICAKELEPATVRRVHVCSTHEHIVGAAGGACPVCERELRPQQMALAWECDAHGVVALAAGRCPQCDRNLAERLLALPHGDHSPKHGGIFFMAPDRWHHLEGTLTEPGTFRLYLYDNFTRPMEPGGVSGYLRRGRVLEDGDIELTREAYPLVPVAGTNTFEATSQDFRVPLDLALFLFLAADGREADRFDFTFTSYSRQTPGAAPGTPPAAERFEIPGSPAAILSAIEERRRTVREHVEKRRLSLLYRPALEVKDLALALSAYVDDLPRAGRDGLDGSLYQTVRSAWLLDVHGDLGDLAEVRQAHALFEANLDRLVALFGVLRAAGER